MAKRHPGLESIDTIIPRGVHAWGAKVERAFYEHSVIWHWPAIAGKDIARNAQPIAISFQVLYLRCPAATWRNELMMLKPTIIAKLNQYAASAYPMSQYANTQAIKDLRFCYGPEADRIAALWQDTLDSEQNVQKKPPEPSHAKAMKGIALEKSDIHRAAEACKDVQDDELRQCLEKLYTTHQRWDKLRKKQSYHPCPRCSTLCPPEEAYCNVCARAVQEETRKKIRRFLRDMPWARYSDIYQEIPCDAEMVNRERARMLQSLASEVDRDDRTSLKARTLVMLYRSIEPEQLTPDIIRRSLYRLRNDLAQPKNFRPQKRYDAIPLARKKKRGT